jgi:hypothetical protein
VANVLDTAACTDANIAFLLTRQWSNMNTYTLKNKRINMVELIGNGVGQTGIYSHLELVD